MRYVLLVACTLSAIAQNAMPIEQFAPAHVQSLRLSAYVTAGEVDALDLSPEGLGAIVNTLRGLGVTRVFIEVYRAGLVVPVERLNTVRDAFEAVGFEVYGGIATVPGGNIGVPQDGPLGWFNWQNEKTQHDIAEVVRNAAPVFHHFIIDDFLCTGDVSEESKLAKGDRDWPDYRRALMTQVARDVLVAPARAANSEITMIVKFPQWYDLFQRHGYDVENMPPLFDQVYIGTETRGARTRRYGYVQPYEGFVNFRWLSAIAGAKTGGAWFDHGDTADHDFVEQAFQSVLAGANEIVLFHFGALVEGHPDHARLVEAFPTLVELADAIDKDPVRGVMAYKPPHSDANGDLYLMDFVGMLGIPLIPTPTFPNDATAIFLPTQAAGDPQIQSKVSEWLGDGRTLIVTAGFLTHASSTVAENLQSFHQWAGLNPGPGTWIPQWAKEIGQRGRFVPLDHEIAIHGDMFIDTAEVLLEVTVDGRPTPFLTRHNVRGATVYAINAHTFTQEDFDAVHEVLLAPRDLGLLYLPRPYATILRNAFLAPLGFSLDAPTRLTFQPFGDRCMIYNYNEDEAKVVLTHGLAEETLSISGRGYHLRRVPE